MTAGLEIEVKLSVADPAATMARLAAAASDELVGFVRVGGSQRVVAVDRYIDTPTGALEAVRARARLREVDGQVTLTVKRGGIESAGVTTRQELEGPATSSLDSATWPDSPARRELVALQGSEPLVETVRLRQHRTVRYLEREAIRVEVSLDELEALDGDRRVATRTELEVELKRGEPAAGHAALAQLAEALLGWPGVGPALGSKRWFAMQSVAAARRGGR